MTTQLDLLDGIARRDAAMTRALDHANAVEASWGDTARDLLRRYCVVHPYFMTEDVRAWAHGTQGLSVPPDSRAWGSVMLSGARMGWYVRSHYAPMKSPNCHAAPKTVWQSNLYRVPRDAAGAFAA
jgi:hypothetical protein